MSASTSPSTTLSNTDARRTVGVEAPDFHFKSSDHALIVGAGLGGCAIASALARRGMHCTVFDALPDAALATSSVPVAICKPAVSAGKSIEQTFISQCFDTLCAELDRCNMSLQVTGLLQSVTAHQPCEHATHWQPASPAQEKGPHAALYSDRAGALRPSTLCHQWLKQQNIRCVFNTAVDTIQQHNGDWHAIDRDGRLLGCGQLLILANAMAAQRWAPELHLTPVSGQISLFESAHTGPVLCDDGYLIPTSDGLWSGATFHRGSTVAANTAVDDAVNLSRCKLHVAVSDDSWRRSWSGVRCTTTDRLPLVGAAPDTAHYLSSYRDLHHGRHRKHYPPATYRRGLYLLTGLGSRGVTQAPLCAEILTDIIFGEKSTPAAFKHALHPARFLIRRLKKGLL